jgi:L-cystine transport system permease protein
MTYHFENIPSLILSTLSAFPVTLEILLISLLISLLIGFVVAVGSLSKNKVLNKIAFAWISFMRGVPTLVMMFLLFLGLPQLLTNLGFSISTTNKLPYIIATLSLTASSNMAEMMRTSYLAVDKGQSEAAYSIGMDGITTLRRIVFPQAFGIAIPMLGNNIVNLFKETSLGFTIGVVDILGKARAISNASFGANKLEVYIAAGIIFWGVCVILEQGSKLLEKMYTKGRKKATS